MNDRKRLVALVVPSLTQGGGVPAVARFVKDAALRSGRYDVRPISLSVARNDASSRLLRRPSTWRRGPLATMGEWEGLAYTHVGANWGELEFQRYRPRAVLRNLIADCDVVQVVCGSPAWANTVLGSGKPIALQVATRTILERHQSNKQGRGLLGWWRRQMTEIVDRLDQCGVKGVDAIQVENRGMYEYARMLTEGRDIDLRFAPPGVDVELFQPLRERPIAKSPYILCVGRLSDLRKNIKLLLEAYALLPLSLRDHVSLVLAGSSPPPDQFWVRAREVGVSQRIRFVDSPTRPFLIQMYQEATVFALPSDEEGLGVVILEAMACGVPVVSTRSGGPEGIITDGEDGYLVERDDAAGMARALARLLDERSENRLMGQRARQTIESKFDHKITGELFVDSWDRLCKC